MQPALSPRHDHNAVFPLQVTFVDCQKPFRMPKAKVDPALMPDLLHPNELGAPLMMPCATKRLRLLLRWHVLRAMASCFIPNIRRCRLVQIGNLGMICACHHAHPCWPVWMRRRAKLQMLRAQV